MNGDDLAAFEPGTVWLVGAGPGDPGLLTRLAVKALQSADLIVYDALVDTRVLDFARADAARLFVGKRARRPSPTQDEISERLIEGARQNKRVLRLKGGDPFVFGRGGDEALALAAADVAFRIVPGVSAGIGGLAYAGIPVTQRGINAAVSFVTGHMAGGDVADSVNWEALAASSPVIVVYMGLHRLQRIAARLLSGGRDPDEAVAIVSHATSSAQRVLETRLGDAAADAAAAGIQAPAIVVIGGVARLHGLLSWFQPPAAHGVDQAEIWRDDEALEADDPDDDGKNPDAAPSGAGPRDAQSKTGPKP